MLKTGVRTVASDEAIRAYIRARRKALKITQEAMALKLYLPHSTYRDWESASTQEMKARPFASAIDVLKIPIGHIKALGDPSARPDDVSKMAGELIPLPSRDPSLDAVLIEVHNRRYGDGHAEQRLRLAQIAERLIDRPELLDEWFHYGEYLLDKAQDRT